MHSENWISVQCQYSKMVRHIKISTKHSTVCCCVIWAKRFAWVNCMSQKGNVNSQNQSGNCNEIAKLNSWKHSVTAKWPTSHSAWSESSAARPRPWRGHWTSEKVEDARKARPTGPSRHLGCVFVERHQKRRMARPKGLSPNLWQRGGAHWAEPTSPFLVASNQNSIPVVSP